jgi:hypothetical protein
MDLPMHHTHAHDHRPAASGRQFCHDVMLARGEPLQGGAGAAPERQLLLYWPHGKWRAPRHESKELSPALAETIRRSGKEAGLPVLLVDRRLSDDPVVTLLSLPDRIVCEPESEAELIGMIEAAGRGEALVGRHDPRTVILCCTDGKRDPCCAKWGFATYKELISLADPKQFNVLETTHQGGCRLAATVTVQPKRERYGRLSPDQIPEFLDAIASGRKYLPAMRGRGGISEAAMVAEIAAMQWAEQHGLAQSEVVLSGTEHPAPADAPGRLAIPVAVGELKLLVDVEPRQLLMAGHCDVLEAGDGKLGFRWVLVGVRVPDIRENGELADAAASSFAPV